MSVFYCEIQDDLAALGPHHIPLEKVKLPLRIQAESFLSGTVQWSENFDSFDRLCQDKGFTINATSKCQAFGEKEEKGGLQQFIFMEEMSDHFIIQLWTMPGPDGSFFQLSSKDYFLEMSSYFNAASICSTLVMIESEYENIEPSSYFGDQTVSASSILDGQATLWTNYQKDPEGRELFLVTPTNPQGKKVLEEIAHRTADSIIHMETLLNLVTLPKDRFRSIVEEIRRLESDLGRNISDISENLGTTDLDRIREWLKKLSMDFATLNGFKQELEQHSANMTMYQDEVERLRTWWKESQLEDEPSLSMVVETNITRFSRDYNWLYRRMSDLSDRVDNMVGILRTRIDILNQRQLLATEKEIHSALGAQLKTHHKLQGLYSIFCAFYFTEISYVVCEALHEEGIIETSAASATAPLIPLYIILGLVFSGTLRRWIERKKE
ncbi:MAG: DUF3422 family protein [Desulfobacteraceae bacterium]|jgi:uncharacterized membrane-anchored protein